MTIAEMMDEVETIQVQRMEGAKAMVALLKTPGPEIRETLALVIRLAQEAARLDTLMTARGAERLGGTDLFRLYHVDDAAAWQDRLAQARIWSRIFPYSNHFLRLGLPPIEGWDRLESAL